MVSEPTLAVSRHIRAEVHGHEHGRVGAQMPPACARTRGGSVHGHLGCDVGTGRTNVAHGLLALDVRDVANRGRSWLGIDRRGRRSLKGVSM